MCMLKKDKCTIRPVRSSELNQLVGLMKAHAEYERSGLNESGLEERLHKMLFDGKPVFSCFVVVKEQLCLGYMTFMKQCSSWDAEEYLHLDCLFLDSSTRGEGIGQELMMILKREAEIQNCSEIQWQTPSFNVNAIRFYERLGAKSKDKKRFFWAMD